MVTHSKKRIEAHTLATTGERIREIREKRGLRQDQLASQAKISKSFLSEIENNNRNVSSQALLRIANILGASVDYLLTGESKETGKRAITIPPELSRAAEDLHLSFNQTVDLLEAQRSIIARRSQKSIKNLTVDDWKELHRTLRRVFG
jgi:transcriptional regulator with XRE-family HTH domain